jgi:tryptophanyl-tRNA synthetase
VDEFMSVRPLEWKGNPRVRRADLVVPVTKAVDGAAAGGDSAGTGELSKNAKKKLLKEQQIAAKKAEKAKEKETATVAAAGNGA